MPTAQPSVTPYGAHYTTPRLITGVVMEGPAEKKSRTGEGENTAAVLYGVDDLRIVSYAPVINNHTVVGQGIVLKCK